MSSANLASNSAERRPGRDLARPDRGRGRFRLPRLRAWAQRGRSDSSRVAPPPGSPRPPGTSGAGRCIRFRIIIGGTASGSTVDPVTPARSTSSRGMVTASAYSGARAMKPGRRGRLVHVLDEQPDLGHPVHVARQRPVHERQDHARARAPRATRPRPGTARPASTARRGCGRRSSRSRAPAAAGGSGGRGRRRPARSTRATSAERGVHRR